MVDDNWEVSTDGANTDTPPEPKPRQLCPRLDRDCLEEGCGHWYVNKCSVVAIAKFLDIMSEPRAPSRRGDERDKV